MSEYWLEWRPQLDELANHPFLIQILPMIDEGDAGLWQFLLEDNYYDLPIGGWPAVSEK